MSLLRKLCLLVLLCFCKGDPETLDGYPAMEKKDVTTTKNPNLVTEFRQGFLGKDTKPAFEKFLGSKMATQRPSTTMGSDVNEVTTEGTTSPTTKQIPKASALLKSKENDEDSRGAFVGVIIGFVFVAAFIIIGIGLATQGIVDRMGSTFQNNPKHPFKLNSTMEDHTPPELRGLGSHPSFVQPDIKNHQNTQQQSPPFIYGKLILNDTSPPSSSSGITSNAFNSMTSMLMAAQAAMVLPSPAEKVTHDLISPKYDDDDDDDDDENSDDTVYECPGLAAFPVVGEIEVSNPFYLQGEKNFDSSSNNDEGINDRPKPITTHSSFYHQCMKGFN